MRAFSGYNSGLRCSETVTPQKSALAGRQVSRCHPLRGNRIRQSARLSRCPAWPIAQAIKNPPGCAFKQRRGGCCWRQFREQAYQRSRPEWQRKIVSSARNFWRTGKVGAGETAPHQLTARRSRPANAPAGAEARPQGWAWPTRREALNNPPRSAV